MPAKIDFIRYLYGRTTIEKVDLTTPEAPFRIYKTTHRNLPDDWDFKLHMNNAYYVST